jgi:hypothetical protein
MEELSDVEKKPSTEGCINCANPVVLKGYPNPLCETCRDGLIKFPIPTGIKIFAGFLLLVIIFSFYKIPKNISIGMHLAKGETAIQEKKYITAQKEFKKVLTKVPGDLEMQCNLLISSFNNNDYATYDSLLKIISQKNFEDQDLFQKVNSFILSTSTLAPLEAFNDLNTKYKNNYYAIPDSVLENYIKANPNDTYIMTAYSTRLSDKENYIGADTILSKILIQDTNYVPALIGMSGIKRMELDYKSSLYYCNRLLDLNKESVYGLASKSRTLLRQKNDKEALLLAEQSYALASNDSYTMASLALAYHFTSKSEMRDGMLSKLSLLKDSSSVITLRYVKDVMSGKESFRN